MTRSKRLTRCITTCLMVLMAPIAGTFDAAAQPSSAVEEGIRTWAPAAENLRVRKSVTALSAHERRRFIKAVLALKSTPSPFDPTLSYYDQFVAWHLSLYPCGMGHEMMRAHGGPMFLPWHRLFLLLFEDALREVSGKRISVPYWDWTDPWSTAAVFAEDFMGGDGDPNQGFAVTSGPFRKGQWTLSVHPIGSEWSPSATTHLTRRFGSFPGFDSLPTSGDVAWLLERPRYDVAPYDHASDPNVSFRNALEGFWQNAGGTRMPFGSMTCGADDVMTATSGPGVHNLVHVWVGGHLGTTPEGVKLGTMFLPTSPNDPVFFLHHSNIDRLWAQWQETYGIDSYEPETCAQDLLKLGCRGNTEADRMDPFEATPFDVADIDVLGYRYDTRDAETPRAGTETRVMALELFRCRVPLSAGWPTPSAATLLRTVGPK